MRTEGILTKWDDDRGFGFIAPRQGGPEVFVHISAFPRDGRRPKVGERLSFETETDAAGRKRATNLSCPDRPGVRPHPEAIPYRRSRRPGRAGWLLPLAAAATLAAYGYVQYVRYPPRQPGSVVPAEESTPSPDFQCDGRTQCSEMHSCAEARFFLHNCPDVEMDGDRDGVPCEQQWCGQ